MIVVMGASGPTGEALVHRLLEKGQAVRAVTRDPGRLRARLDPVGVDVRYADAADEDSLVDSFAGANQIFLAMANSPAQVDLETRVVATAAKCSIEHIVKLSAPYVAPDSPSRSRVGTMPSSARSPTAASHTHCCARTPSCRRP
ncbi:NAD(P)H-binding protein [Prescottella defluvii]|nr:NAD(P)H-binding protein [Prescottella defluvii]